MEFDLDAGAGDIRIAKVVSHLLLDIFFVNIMKIDVALGGKLA